MASGKLKERIIKLLTESPLTQVSICRLLNEKDTWCKCKGYLNPRRRGKGVYDEDCSINLSKVRNELNKLIFEGLVLSIRARVKDKGQARGWDVMTTYYLYDGTIFENYGQRKIKVPNQTTLISIIEDHNCLENLEDQLDYYEWFSCKICGKKFPPWTFNQNHEYGDY